MNIPKILTLIRPGEQWALSGEDYSGLKWLDKTPMPTFDEITKGQTMLDGLSYQALRRVAYPSLEDQLDALWKGGQAMTDMQTQIQAIKTKYPGPTKGA